MTTHCISLSPQAGAFRDLKIGEREREEKKKKPNKQTKQNLIFQGLYVGQDLASLGPSASRTESYLIISMATAVGLEQDEGLGRVAGIQSSTSEDYLTIHLCCHGNANLQIEQDFCSSVAQYYILRAASNPPTPSPLPLWGSTPLDTI